MSLTLTALIATVVMVAIVLLGIKFRIVWKIAASVVIGIGMYGIGIFSLLALGTSRLAANFITTTYIFLYVSIVLAIFIGKKQKAIPFIAFGLTGMLLVVSLGIIFNDLQIRNIPTLNDTVLTYNYDPKYSDSQIVHLTEKPTFKFTEDVYFDGATALFPVYAAFANETFAPYRIREDYNDYLTCTKTKQAYENIINGTADVIFVAGASEQQKAAAQEQGVELVFTPIGKEAFVFFVNAKNPVDNLTIENIQDIYSGKITRWNEVGSDSKSKIKPYQRPEGSGSQTALQKLMGDIPLIEPEKNETTDFMMGMITNVADYKNYDTALGYSFRFYTTQMVANNDIKLLSINGIAPTRENIINESYPIVNTFYAVTRSDASQEVQDFVQWCLSEQGQYIINETGYVGIS